MLERLVKWWADQDHRATLRSLDDRILADMGIDQANIDHMVRRGPLGPEEDPSVSRTPSGPIGERGRIPPFPLRLVRDVGPN